MENKQKIGYIYILINRSFKDGIVKIGYSENVEERVASLSGTGLPYNFEIYATYEVPAQPNLSDKLLHELISILNPELRINPKREFFNMNEKDALNVLELMAQIHGREDKVKCYFDIEIEREESHKRGPLFSFMQCNIPIGSIITYKNDSTITAKVIDDRKIEYQGEIMYMTTLAKKLTGLKTLPGPQYFNYEGKSLQEYYMEYQYNKNR